jgi:archaellum component FlaG (FlaF/FlaG flagellin family)
MDFDKKHTQIIHFDNQTKATLIDVVKVWQNTLVHLVTESGHEFIINPGRVLYTEIIWNEDEHNSSP